ncbi:unnamed protein product [Blepharisma stoltei]|uniref:Translin-associated factor X-interacting protein 1 N-terminal domain-containing protein n=1 Tax=Blepharisma stoltei TaxID=1481888 RepID=A0AAU9K956_9CILI|nr:unnamed protein product [Blepharisma stoltei]
MFNRDQLKLKRNFTRQSRRISEIHHEHLSYDLDKDHDLLTQFQTFKRKYRSKQNSPYHSEYSYPSSPKKRDAASSLEIKSKETNPKAESPTFDFTNVLKAARYIEMIPPDRSITQFVSQDKSNNRLYRGARIIYKHQKEEDSLVYKYADLVSNKKEIQIENDLILKEKSECNALIDSLKYMKDLKFVLELNFEIARGNEAVRENGALGDFFKLEEELKNYQSLAMKNVYNYSYNDFIEKLKEYSRILRDILRSVKSKGRDNEAVLIEMLWRTLVKLYDSSLVIHEFHINQVVESAKLKVKEVLEDSRQKIKALEEKLQDTKQRLEGEIQKNKDYIKTLTLHNSELERELINQNHKIKDLTEMDSRDLSCVEMSKIFQKLNQYISESEDQQKKQVETLVNLSQVISLAEEFDKKPILVDIEIQTQEVIQEAETKEKPNNFLTPSPMPKEENECLLISLSL